MTNDQRSEDEKLRDRLGHEYSLAEHKRRDIYGRSVTVADIFCSGFDAARANPNEKTKALVEAVKALFRTSVDREMNVFAKREVIEALKAWESK